MRKLRNLKSRRKNTWTDLRVVVKNICEEYNISDDDFNTINIHEWKEIEEKIWNKFSSNSHSGWLWNGLNCPVEAIQIDYNSTFSLTDILPLDEKVWILLGETINNGTKYWCFEGDAKTADILFWESISSEMIISSKKLEWLLTVDHSDVVVGTGILMDKISKLKN